MLEVRVAFETVGTVDRVEETLLRKAFVYNYIGETEMSIAVFSRSTKWHGHKGSQIN